MATIEHGLHGTGPAHPLAAHRTAGDQTRLHRLKSIRMREGLSCRRVARRLGIKVSQVERQEAEAGDLRISTLHKWSTALGVPIAELLVESEEELSPTIRTRGQLVRIMKTAKAIHAKTGEEPIKRMAEMLIDQLNQIMPELHDVSQWHSVGQRRTEDELGRAAERMLPDQFFGESLDSDRP